jgi:hypothetical protein
MAKITLATGLSYQFIDKKFPAESLAPMNALLAAGVEAEADDSEVPLRRWIGYQFGDCRMSKANVLAKLPFRPGDPSPFFETLDNLTQEGAIVTRGATFTDSATIHADLPSWLLPSQMALIVAVGGDITDEPVYFQLNDLTEQVPTTFPERFMEDGTTVHTWATWGIAGANHHPVVLGANTYRSSQYGYGGVCLKASEWVPYLLARGVVLNSSQYRAVLAENQSTP